ncbi:MAG: acyl-ACP--UDP-N-acetylglucosamine O-acyltransferase [Betaproteobacteria bacterium]|nr:acyl-ACP--UDP-N-acetylglucosamine O-acyltransferase [Betaproteobacteria bacterium]
MIHPTALIAPTARLGEGVAVGPYAVIGPDVEIGRRTAIGAHAVITGHTRIGEDNKIFHFVSLGEAPQDKKYAGEATRLEIGDRNVIREFCTFNCGTVQDAGVTRIGDDNWIMAYVHIAHDCHIGDHTIFANNASLAGHVHVGDYAVLGGFTLVHQFCRIGAYVITAIASVLFKDVPPYVMAAGNPAKPHGINAEGLKRHAFTPDAIMSIKRAFKTLYRSGLTLAEAKAALSEQHAASPDLARLMAFLDQSERGIIR